MKTIWVLTLGLVISGNGIAQTCEIGSGSQMKHVSDSMKQKLTIEYCTDAAVNAVVTDAKLKLAQPFKVEYRYETPAQGGKKPYAYNVEMIVENTKASAGMQSAPKPVEKR